MKISSFSNNVNFIHNHLHEREMFQKGNINTFIFQRGRKSFESLDDRFRVWKSPVSSNWSWELVENKLLQLLFYDLGRKLGSRSLLFSGSNTLHSYSIFVFNIPISNIPIWIQRNLNQLEKRLEIFFEVFYNKCSQILKL